MSQNILNKSRLEFQNLYKNFNQGVDVVKILERANFVFEQGCTYSITGISGVGKSTVLHLLSGLELPTSGTICFDGQDVNKFSKDKKRDYLQNVIGLIFQYPYLLNELSVVENVMLKGLISGQDYKSCHVFAVELLKRVGLESKADLFPVMLSGGQQHRVSLARALFSRPKFLIADEPTAHLDDLSKKAIVDLLLDCQQAWNMGLVIATHDPEVSSRMGTQVVISSSDRQLVVA